jgi:hypothetical protein
MSIFDKMKQGASDAARKAQQTLEIAKLNGQKSSREKDMSKLYSKHICPESMRRRQRSSRLAARS